jgi:hypothetical protein
MTRPREALRFRSRPRILASGVMEYWSVIVLRILRIAPGQRVEDAFRTDVVSNSPKPESLAVLLGHFMAGARLSRSSSLPQIIR